MSRDFRASVYFIIQPILDFLFKSAFCKLLWIRKKDLNFCWLSDVHFFIYNKTECGTAGVCTFVGTRCYPGDSQILRSVCQALQYNVTTLLIHFHLRDVFICRQTDFASKFNIEYHKKCKFSDFVKGQK